MTRIVSGFAGSLTIEVPRSGTRPTSDRVREAIFSALDARGAVEDARVLDLFAGSGALGLEAASRGARQVTLVERSPQSAAVCRRNAESVSRAAPRASAPSITVETRPVQAYLSATKLAAADRFSLAFLDPPYDLGNAELAEALTALAPLLDDDAVVVVERSARTAAPELPPRLVIERRKDYGDTTLWWLRAERSPHRGDQPTAPSQPR